MITRQEQAEARRRAAEMIRDAGLVISDAEAHAIEVADFGLSRLEREGIQVLTMFATDRIAGKILVLFPEQTEPEHWHPPVGDDPGKEETVRIVAGTVRFYVPGEHTLRDGFVPDGKDGCYTVRHEIVMRPGDQLTLPPGTKHWFQTDEQGAVMFSFSTCVRDVLDGFTDPDIERVTTVVDAADPAGG